MAFPFWWVGGLTAALVLGAALVAFMLLERLISRTVDNVRSAMVPGLVAGFQTWTPPGDQLPGAPPPASSPDTTEVEELSGPGPEVLERVHPRR